MLSVLVNVGISRCKSRIGHNFVTLSVVGVQIIANCILHFASECFDEAHSLWLLNDIFIQELLETSQAYRIKNVSRILVFYGGLNLVDWGGDLRKKYCKTLLKKLYKYSAFFYFFLGINVAGDHRWKMTFSLIREAKIWANNKVIKQAKITIFSSVVNISVSKSVFKIWSKRT